ncbi:Rz1 protein precursor-related protein [Haloferax elongans ATCC BAA-1513]|uniref:Rz1 protein-related protein n=1 Tax=Haloferax elongans ATCC BAA-1513 TaxID=1230453 RepID=M0HFZ8_HALEO|nr:Rz1 protein precursor-related protein [Haloferax elongans ATCC BAA-1513]
MDALQTEHPTKWVKREDSIFPLTFLFVLLLGPPLEPIQWEWVVVGAILVFPWLYAEFQFDDWRSWLPSVVFCATILLFGPQYEGVAISLFGGVSAGMLGMSGWRAYRRRIRSAPTQRHRPR